MSDNGEIDRGSRRPSICTVYLVGAVCFPPRALMPLSSSTKRAIGLLFAQHITLVQHVVFELLGAAQQEHTESAFKRRRGGWHPKPRLHVLYGRDDEGAQAWEHDTSRSTMWFYLQSPDEPYYNQLFCKVVGVPRRLFQLYLDLLRDAEGFRAHQEGEAQRGRDSKALEMKLVSWFLVLTTGCSFQHASAVCCLSEPVVRRFFHKLNAYLVKHEYSKHVQPPEGPAEVAACGHKFAKMGFPGAITTIDATHVQWLNCPSMDGWRNTGKDGFPTRSFNCAVGPCLEFHHVHKSHPGAHNDKTISRCDQFMQDLKHGRLYGDYTFELLKSVGEAVTWKGLYAIVDGGYHAWRCLQYPNKKSAMWADMRWSKRMESVRKCSERAFGVLKKRFGILKIGFPFKDSSENTVRCDNTFKVCAMLHNQLLRMSAYDTIGDAECDWVRATTERDEDRIRRDVDKRGAGADEAGQPAAHWVNDLQVGNETVQDVEGAHVDLYHALVAHYVVCWEQEDVWWPKTAVRLRGKVDRREREAGGGRCARDADEERHAFISDVDNGDEGSGSDQDY